MSWNKYGFIICIIAIVIATNIEARGGRGGGGKSGGGGGRSSGGSGSGGSSHSSGGSGGSYSSHGSSGGSHSSGGFWSNLFGGSRSSSKSSLPSISSKTSSNVDSHASPVHNSYPYYQHSGSYANTFESRSSNTQDLNDFINGLHIGSHLSHQFINENSQLHENANIGNGYISPRVLVIAHHEPGVTTESVPTEASPTEDTTEISTNDMLKILNELQKPFDSSESLDAFLDRMSKIDFSKVWNKSTLVENTDATTSEPIASESSTSSTEFLPDVTQQSHENNMSPMSVTPMPIIDTDELITTTLETSNVDMSTPYGVICLPMVYNEINEFGVNVTIERMACYPAQEPVAL